MKNSLLRFSITVFSISFLLACGSRKKIEQSIRCADFLPASVDKIGAVRTETPRTFVGDSLFQYIDGGAEIYHEYHFLEVATANYRSGEIEMTVDIYRFETSDYAYGLYSTLRPDHPDLLSLGVEAFATPTSVDFVKGPFAVRVVAFDQTPQTSKDVKAMAARIDAILPASNNPPATFTLFPAGGAIEASGMIYARSFLGQKYLTDVYTRRYIAGSDTLTLFVSEDESGEKFAKWFESASAEGWARPGPTDIPYDDGRVLVMDSDYYGRIIAGLKNGRLAGIIKYDDSRREFLSEWLLSLP